MAAVQAMTGSGGWPMSVFLTPDGHPFFSGTYFPPEPAHGLPSFRQALAGAARAWRTERLGVVASGQRLVDNLVAQNRLPTDGAAPSSELLAQAEDALQSRFDTLNGSWGGAPKFPQPMTIDFLLRRFASGVAKSGAMVRYTLDRMADGGIHDQLGGGFHRYATDPIWLVPHFEQMLYDNAQLARTYLRAWDVFRSKDGRATLPAWLTAYREVAEGVLDYLLRELRRDDGTFAASQDADTGGVEGATFTWSAAEIREVLADDAPLFTTTYGVRDEGNWEGRTILSRLHPASGEDGVVDPAREAGLADARARLLERRGTRPQPARDDKALAAWNGLAIGALADAARLLPSPAAERYGMAAIAAAETILGGLRRPDGRLGRSWKDGRSSGEGVLEDYADLADGLLALYEATFDERWFTIARELADTILDHFEDPAGGFFDTADDHEALVTRPKDPQDNATPSGGSMATLVLLRLAALTGEARYREAADRAIATVTGFFAHYPSGFANWLSAAQLAVGGIVELAIVGDPFDPATGALLHETREHARQDLVVALAADPSVSVVPLLAGRTAIGDRPTAYVCRQFTCRMPVTDPTALRDQLRAPV
jgi:uncharacterized protein YyaL (SSP411 family)